MKSLFVSTIFIFCSFISYSQQFIKVHSLTNGLPIDSVKILAKNVELYSDTEGLVRLSKNYTFPITISKHGFKTQNIEQRQVKNTINVWLVDANDNALPDVIVIAVTP